jgi:hypothetical protein
MHHLKAVREAGASEAEVLGVTRIALDVRDNATEVMAEVAQGSLNYEHPGKAQSGSIKQPIDNLVALGAALACNSVTGLEYYSATTKAQVLRRKIQTAMGIARSVEISCRKADSRIRVLIRPTQVVVRNKESIQHSM